MEENQKKDVVKKNSIQSIMSNTEDSGKNLNERNPHFQTTVKIINKQPQKRAVVVLHRHSPKMQITPKNTQKISLPVPDLSALNAQTVRLQTQQANISQSAIPKIPNYTDYSQFSPQTNYSNQQQQQIQPLNLSQMYYQFQQQNNYSQFSPNPTPVNSISQISQIQNLSPIQTIPQINATNNTQTQQKPNFSNQQNFSTVIQENFTTPSPSFFTTQQNKQNVQINTQTQQVQQIKPVFTKMPQYQQTQNSPNYSTIPQPSLHMIHPLQTPQIQINAPPLFQAQNVYKPQQQQQQQQNSLYQKSFPTPVQQSPKVLQPSPILPIQQQQQPTPAPVQPPPPPRLPLPLPHPAVTLPQVDQHTMEPPEPVYYNDEKTGRYGIRCVCGEGNNDTNLILCDLCNFWLHTKCVNVARVSENESYYCPFCRGQRIRCTCEKTKNYESSIVQCTVCKFWQHKDCENLDYGFIPHDFVCSICDPNKIYDLPFHQLKHTDINIPNDFVAICNKEKRKIVDSIPDGHFKDMIMKDLNKMEITFCETMAKYFHEFATLLFDRIHEFWKCYVDTFSQIFEVDKKLILSSIDVLANKLIYNPSCKAVYPPIDSFYSEAIIPMIQNLSLPKYDKTPNEVKIVMKGGKLYSKENIEDNQYILDIPGFLEYFDEVRADNGIPYSCLSVTNKEFVVDVNGSVVPLLAHIRRSFHFNCVVKMIKIQGEVKVALYATRPTGPLSEDKGRRGPAIQIDQELFLPLDGYIPFPTKKVEWKDKKIKSRSTSQQAYQPISTAAQQKEQKLQRKFSYHPPPPIPEVPIAHTTITTRSQKHHVESPPPLPLTRDKSKKKKHEQQNPNQSQQDRKKGANELNFSLSLLSGFTYDIIPPIPIKLHDPNKDQPPKEKKQKRRSRHTSD